MNYRQAIEFVVLRRRDDEAKALAFYKRLMNENADFHAIETELRRAELELARGKKSEKEVQQLREKREKLIDELGVRDRLYPPYRCPICHDTGLDHDGKPCSCASALTVSERNDNIELPLRDFSEFNPALFGENAPVVERVASDLKTIADKGNSAVRKNIDLIGKAGTGKTFLASCFANECLKNGRTVVFITAFSLVRRALDYHTSFGDNRRDGFTPLLEADALIIDDLGTESNYKNVTLEYFYHVINERQLRGKTTFITSNLSIDGIANKYGERIASRLFDRKICYATEFNFGDIRKIKI